MLAASRFELRSTCHHPITVCCSSRIVGLLMITQAQIRTPSSNETQFQSQSAFIHCRCSGSNLPSYYIPHTTALCMLQSKTQKVHRHCCIAEVSKNIWDICADVSGCHVCIAAYQDRTEFQDAQSLPSRHLLLPEGNWRAGDAVHGAYSHPPVRPAIQSADGSGGDSFPSRCTLYPSSLDGCNPGKSGKII
jgi:hypothetical protein